MQPRADHAVRHSLSRMFFGGREPIERGKAAAMRSFESRKPVIVAREIITG